MFNFGMILLLSVALQDRRGTHPVTVAAISLLRRSAAVTQVTVIELWGQSRASWPGFGTPNFYR
jgi:hypothetical protein